LLHISCGRKLKKESSDIDFLLVNRVCRGDPQAFREIVERYKDMSYTLSFSILKDEHESEDALQDAFLKALNSIHKFRFECSFATWLYRIVFNTCMTAKARRSNRSLLQIGDDLSIGSEQSADQESLLDEERKQYIDRAFKMMREEEALLLRLHYLCDMSITEITKITKYSESNVKVTLHRGRKSLYEVLDKLLGKEKKMLL
jgi:RNA polymerase sigma factor (sigma-70 family)